MKQVNVPQVHKLWLWHLAYYHCWACRHLLSVSYCSILSSNFYSSQSWAICPWFDQEFYTSLWTNRGMHKVSQREMKSWISFFFETILILLRAREVIVCWSLFWKLGGTPWISSCHSKNFKEMSRSKIGFFHGLCHPKSQIGLCKVSLA